MITQERRPIAAANWKMHLLRAEVEGFCRVLLRDLPSRLAEVLIFPSFPLIPVAAQALAASSVALGGQDLHVEAKGAHTGDVSGPQLVDAGCSWALCGHSERRRDHREDDGLVTLKVAAALRHGLRPLLCVGETLEERQQGRTFAVLERQLTAALPAEPAGLVVAYEPVWAIGTGQTATPEIAQEAHYFLRQVLAGQLGAASAGSIRLLYGGSVSPENASSLARQPDVDGFLVGGASLDPEKFLAIIRSCEV